MQIQEVFDISRQELENLISPNIHSSSLSTEGYSSESINLASLGLSFEGLPNQFYKNHGQVNRLPFPDKDDRGLGVTSVKYEEGILTIDTYCLRRQDDILSTFIQGHEEGHACKYLGKLSEVYDLFEKSETTRRLTTIAESLYPREKAKASDIVMLKGLFSCGIPEDQTVGLMGLYRALFLLSVEQDYKNPDSVLDKVCNLCGLYAVTRKGYDLDEAYKHIEEIVDLGFEI